MTVQEEVVHKQTHFHLSLEGEKAVELFDRKPHPDYLTTWKESLRVKEEILEAKNLVSFLVFRLGKEWLAISTSFCLEISRRPVVHLIPHRTSAIIQGVVNINGELKLYVALHDLLKIETSIEFQTSRIPYQRNRMLVIAREKEVWSFPVDEIEGVARLDPEKLENVPVNLAKSEINYFQGIVSLEEKRVGVLDEELLFASLNECLKSPTTRS